MKYLFTAAEYCSYLEWLKGQPYWYGTCQYGCTQSLLTRKADQYPSHYTSSRMPRYKDDVAKKKACADCVGVQKGAAWTNLGRQTNKYKFGGVPDTSADGMYNFCVSQGMDHGTIDTFPKIAGYHLHMSGHTGVYLGDGLVFEERGFAYGAVITQLSARPWKKWCAVPWVEYGTPTTDPVPSTPIAATLGSRLLKLGRKGDDVKALQTILITLGYDDLGDSGEKHDGVDGDYGPLTRDAVKAFQKDNKLKVDGEYGDKTHAVLMSVLAEREAAENEDEESETEPTKTITVTGGSVYVRSGPGTAYDIITVVRKGAKLPCLATAENGWHGTVANGKAGWITGKYTEITAQ